MARKDIEKYMNELKESGILDQALLNQYVLAMKDGIAIPRYIKDTDLIRNVRKVAKKFTRTLSDDDLREIIHCVRVGVPEKYLIDELNYRQLEEIRVAYYNKVDLAVLVNPIYPADAMYGGTQLLKAGFSKKIVREYLDLIVKRPTKVRYDIQDFSEMLRWYIEDGGDISKVAPIVKMPNACNEIAKMREELLRKK